MRALKTFTRIACVWALVLSASSCSPRPLHKGPDVVKVPAGFVYDGNVQVARNFFPERPKLLERGYMTAEIADDEHSEITITRYAGPTSGAEVEAAIHAEQDRYGHSDYGAVESLTIDRRPAWGWVQLQPKGAPHYTAMEYRAVVSYEDATYLVEFYTTHPRFLVASRLKDVVLSFEVND